MALIDDWGNPSPGKSATDWFGFAGIMLPDDEIDRILSCHNSVCRTLGHNNTQSIHFRNLDLNSKYHITRILAENKPTISIIAVRINEISSSRLSQRGWAYRFFGRELVRVATHFAAELGETANVIFHHHEYLNDFDRYIHVRLRGNSWYMNKDISLRIVYERLNQLDIKDDKDDPLLGMADCVANACHNAFNPHDRWKATNPTCLNLLSDCIYQGPPYNLNPRQNGAMLGPGGSIPTRLISDLPYAIGQYWE